MGKFVKSGAVLAALVSVVASISSARAEDPAQSLYDQAVQAFAGRENLAEVDRSLGLLDEAAKVVVDSNLKYDILVLASRNLYWKGNHQKTDAEKMAVFELGMAKANDAKAVNDDYAEGYYFYAINLGKWGLANGIIPSLKRSKELRDRKSTRLNSSHSQQSRMPSSA